jgi:CDP-diacylglycerol--glycerol-3-phosphate 3-phosphatidyltransferase
VSRVLRAFPARALTLSRIFGLPPFLWLLVRVADGGTGAAALAALYLVLALSDYLDGPLARRAGTADPRWGTIDVTADVLFNLCALSAASALGLVGVWVPAGVALLAARFALRNLVSRRGAGAPLAEDRAGKLAGVLFYLLVGLVTFEIATGGLAGAFAVRVAGDAVFAWTLFAFWSGRRLRPGARTAPIAIRAQERARMSS